jgi:branched-chain amino acid aminotransferase
VVKDGGLTTNDEDAGVLMGITRASVLELAGTLGIPVRIAPITVDDLRRADELFFTGTAVEVTPIKDLDGQPVGGGLRGPVTTRVQQAFLDVVQGRDPRYRHWLTYA